VWHNQPSHGDGTFNIGAPSLLWLNGTSLQTLLDGKVSAPTVTNIARFVRADAVVPYTLGTSGTVTVPRLPGTNTFVMTLTGAATLAISTNSWTAAEVARFSIDVNRGTNTLAFTTGHMSGSTVLDVPASTLTPLFFRKPSGSVVWRVRQ
jgi:hypothetical protein